MGNAFGCNRRREPQPPLRVVVEFSDAQIELIDGRWRRVLRRVLRLRSRQRLWAYLGHLLFRECKASLRQRLLKVFPSGLAELKEEKKKRGSK